MCNYCCHGHRRLNYVTCYQENTAIKERKLKEKNAAAEVLENLLVFYSNAFVITLHTPYFFFCLMNWGGERALGRGGF